MFRARTLSVVFLGLSLICQVSLAAEYVRVESDKVLYAPGERASILITEQTYPQPPAFALQYQARWDG